MDLVDMAEDLGPWIAWASVPSPLWLHHCGADVNGDLYLSH